MKTDPQTADMSRTEVSQADHDLRLTEVLEEYLSDLERGTAPDRETVLARHPDLAQQLSKCLDSPIG